MSQETLLRVFNGMQQFRGEGRIEVWIFRVAHSVYLNAVRARSVLKRSGSEVPFEPENEPAEDSPSSTRSGEPLDQALIRERQVLLSRAIEELPPQMRRCIQLRVMQDLKYREIAEVLHISVDSVKAHLYQARQHLQRNLRDHYPDIEL
jgi:RNA polymerase sigma-70 factor (ECF subfamily)